MVLLNHTHPCNSNFRFSYSYLSLSAHLQVHKSVHLSDASLHLHWEQVSDLQLHFTNSLASLLDSYCDIHFGTQVQLAAFECFLPKAWGDGRFWWDCKHLLQTPHWKIARKVCRNSVSSVGGIVSIFLFRWKYRRMRASLTFVKIDVLWYIKIVNLWMLWNLASSWVKLWKGLLKKKAKVDSAFGHTFRVSYSGVCGKTA